MATKPKIDQDKADEQGARISSKAAYQLGGLWYAGDGRQLTDPVEIQQAHRAADKKAAAARERALLGRA